MHYVCGENGLKKQLSPLRKRKAVIRKNELRLQEIHPELPRRGIPYPTFFETPSAGALFCLSCFLRSFISRARGRLRMTKNRSFAGKDKWLDQNDKAYLSRQMTTSFANRIPVEILHSKTLFRKIFRLYYTINF